MVRVQLAIGPIVLGVVIGIALLLLVGFISLTLWVWVLVLLALILAAAITPIVRFIQRAHFPPGGWHLSKGFAVIITILATFLLISIGAYVLGGLLVTELTPLSGSLSPVISARLETLASALLGAGFPPDVVPGPDRIVALVRDVVNNSVTFVLSAIPNYVTFFVRFFIVLTLAAFLVVESDSALAFWVSLFPPARRALVRDLTTRSGRTMGYWVLGTLLEAAIVGALGGLVAWLFGLPAPALLGLLAAIIQLIPVTGAILMAIPGFLLGLLQSPTVAVEAALAYVIIAQVNASYIAPAIARWSVSLSPLVVIIAVPLGGALYGAIGGLIAIPVAAAIQIFVIEVVLPWLHHVEGETGTAAEPEAEPPRRAA